MDRRSVLSALTATAALGTVTAVSATAAPVPAAPKHAPGKGTTDRTFAQEILFWEDFESVRNPMHFTHRMPEGWSVATDDVTSGEERWDGWTLTDIRNWSWATEGPDERHFFTRGHEQIAVVESSRQRLYTDDTLNTALTTPPIRVKGHDAVELTFSSHFRKNPEGSERAVVSVAFDGGEATDLLTLIETAYSDRPRLVVEVPAGAKHAAFTFAYRDGHNDFWWAIDDVRVATVLPEPPAGDHVTVDVLSDVQGGLDHYTRAITVLNGLEDPASAVVFNGDTVDLGTQELYDEYLAVRDATPHASGTEIYSSGNHEFYGDEGSEVYQERFLTLLAKTEKPYQEHDVDGVPVLVLGTEFYSDVESGGKEPFMNMSDEQLAWLDERLGFWEKRGVTVLLISHFLLPQTVSASYSPWYNDYNRLDELAQVLGAHANVVMFTSHSHHWIGLNDWWGTFQVAGAENRYGIPVVNTGALLNAYVSDGELDETKLEGEHATGTRVKVYADRVRVEAWNLLAGEPMKHVDFPRLAANRGKGKGAGRG